MANNNHAVFVGTHCTYWDCDSMNYVGIAATDLDNGIFVSLGAMSPNNDGAYEFTVAPTNSPEFVCGSAPQGYGIDAQVYDDPRYFTNEAGKPIGVKRLLKYDCIEVDATAFTAEPADEGYANVQASGKLTATSTESNAHFAIKGARTMDVGGEFVKTWVLQKLV